MSSAGVDIGELNHSDKFVANWGVVCSSVINGRLKRYLSAPLPQTGHRPPVRGVCDKATWQHNSRMLSGFVTVVPDSPILLQGFIPGTEVCPRSGGLDMANSLVKSWDQYIVKSQV